MERRLLRWAEASARLLVAIEPSLTIPEARQVVTDIAQSVTGATAVTIGTREPDPVGAVCGDARFGPLTAALSARVPQLIEEILEERLDGTYAVVVPLRAHLAGRGALIAWYDAPPTSEQQADREPLATFAEQAALALDRAQALEDRADLAVVSDRERIARDLHDVVIQRIYATGLQLQAVGFSLSDPVVRGRLEDAVRALDTTMADIRRTIFQLQHRAAGSLRAEVRDLVREYVAVLGHVPVVRISGPLDTDVTERVRTHLVSVLREALSNIAKHARAGATEISLEVSAAEVVLTVADDGIGFGSPERSSGLANARRRAEELGGSFTVAARAPRGTVVSWTAPVRA